MTTSRAKIFAIIALCSCLVASAFATTETAGMQLCHPTDEVYEIFFPADEIAQIRLMGDGSTILSLYVYDQNGILVLSDQLSSDGDVEWRALLGGLFAVKVDPIRYSVDSTEDSILTNGTCRETERDPVAQ